MDQADISAGLRAAVRQEQATIADAVVAEPAADPVEAAPSEPASEPSTAEPEAPAETPEPEVQAEPSDSPEGAEPAEPAEQSFDLADALKSTGIDISKFASPQEALPHVLKQLRSKIAEQGEKLKQATVSPAAETPQAQAQPQAPAPPAPAAQPVADQVNAEVKARLSADLEVTQAVQAYRDNDARIKAIDDKTLPDSLPGIARRIQRLQDQLPEARKAEGLEEPDDITTADIKARILGLQTQERLLRLEKVELKNTNAQLRDGYDRREAHYRREIEGRHQDALLQEQETKRVAEEADSFVGLWRDTFGSVITKLGVTDEETKAEIWNGAADQARLDPSVVGDNLAGYIESYGQKILARNDRIRRDAARVSAQRKAADVKTQAPVGPAAVAPPKPTTKNTGDPFAALHAANRARYAAP